MPGQLPNPMPCKRFQRQLGISRCGTQGIRGRSWHRCETVRCKDSLRVPAPSWSSHVEHEVCMPQHSQQCRRSGPLPQTSWLWLKTKYVTK